MLATLLFPAAARVVVAVVVLLFPAAAGVLATLRLPLPGVVIGSGVLTSGLKP